MRHKTVIQILSGGMDSVTSLYYLHNLDYNLKAISVNYGQKHNKELQLAEYHCKKLNIEHKIVDLSNISELINGDSVLVNKDKPIPDGHYENKEMRQTIVPNRNMMLLSIATAWAINCKFDAIAYGNHAGDSAVYPDCRTEFVDVMSKAVSLCDWHKIELISPFVNYTKADIAKIGTDLRVDYKKTWTCYKGQDIHCGMCATCIERREAFYLAGVKDPTIYKSTATPTDVLVKNNWGKNE